MTARDRRIADFIRRGGWEGAVRSPLAVDASFRRYERLARADQSIVLMDAPPPHENVASFVTVANHLRALGYSAPEVVLADLDHGLLLVEDFGDDTYTACLAAGHDERALYALAVDLLADLHGRDIGRAAADLPVYSPEILLDEVARLVDWYLVAIVGEAAARAERAAYLEAWREALVCVDALAPTLVLRDFHVDNLVWLGGREGVARCGLLDFQDAVIGSPAFDLVSLLADARRDIAPDLIGDMRARYAAARVDHDRLAFDAAYRTLGAQRSARIVGQFTRLDRRDGKPGYLCHIPRTLALLSGFLAAPATGGDPLAPVRAWYQRVLPPERRRVPEPSAAA